MREKIEVALTYRLGWLAQPKHLSLGSAVPDKAALQIFKEDVVGDMIQHGLKQGIGLRQGSSAFINQPFQIIMGFAKSFLSSLSLGDVNQHPLHNWQFIFTSWENVCSIAYP